MLQVRCRAFQSFSRAGNFVKWPFTVHAFLLLPAPSSWFPAPQTTSWSVCTLLVWTVNRENCIKGGTDHPQTMSVVQISWKILHWMNRKWLQTLALPLQGRPPPHLTICRLSLTVSFSPSPVGMAVNKSRLIFFYKAHFTNLRVTKVRKRWENANETTSEQPQRCKSVFFRYNLNNYKIV